jgi:hypothetical protein
MNIARWFLLVSFCLLLPVSSDGSASAQNVLDYRYYSWSPLKENWDFGNAIVVKQPTSGSVFLNSSGQLVYRNDDNQVKTDEFELLVGADNLVASVVVSVDKLSGLTTYKFNGENTATPPNGGNSGIILGEVGSPTTLPQSHVTGTVVGQAGTDAPIPTSGTIKIFVSDNTIEDDSWSIWHDLGGSGTYFDGVKSWTDIRNDLFFLENDTVDVIVLSGHGASSGGTHTNDPTSELDAASLTDTAIEVIKSRASDDAVIVILSCSQWDELSAPGIQDLADTLGIPVIVNSGSVSSGTNGSGIWVRVDPVSAPAASDGQTDSPPPVQSGGN